jgi:hypothetical protein
VPSPSPTLTAQEGRRYLRELEGVLGKGWVHDQVAKYEALLNEWKEHPYRFWLSPNLHPLVLGLAEYREWRSNPDPRAALPTSVVSLFELAFYVSRVLTEHVSSERAAREYLKRRLCAEGAGDILFEIRIAATLGLRGHQVKWLSPEDENAPDIETMIGSVRVMVECKCQGLGAGRQISHKVFWRLVGEVDRVQESRLSEYGIVIEPLARLEESDLEQIVSRLAVLLPEVTTTAQEELIARKGTYVISVRRLCGRTERVTLSEAESLAKSMEPQSPGSPHLAVATSSSQDRGARPDTPINPRFLLCKSRKPDRVIADLMEFIAAGARRLPTDAAGIVAIHIPEYVDWHRVRQKSLSLDHAVTRTLRRGSKKHVSEVIFSSEAQVNPLGPRYSGQLPTFTYRNTEATIQLPSNLTTRSLT